MKLFCARHFCCVGDFFSTLDLFAFEGFWLIACRFVVSLVWAYFSLLNRKKEAKGVRETEDRGERGGENEEER